MFLIKLSENRYWQKQKDRNLPWREHRPYKYKLQALHKNFYCKLFCPPAKQPYPSFTKEHYKNINKRPSRISSSKEVFDKAITFYPKALKKKKVATCITFM